ncbi:sigma-70 family RNA polymerase sigma factor [Pendulispora rubella]|uniref:Sigma-70 family RNA polymerase sigma factor n=2 Tax=Pendulispora rubella TaxID=2741070 RepID=A0ABZ2LIZ2_9BACT
MLAGDPRARRTFVQELEPVVRAQVTRALLRQRTRARRRDVRQDVEDMVQDVFAAFFADHGKCLRAWSPERGSSFSSFVGLVAERHVAAILRSGRKSPWSDDATEPGELEAWLEPDPAPEAHHMQGQLARAVIERVAHELSPRGQEFLRVIFLEEKPVNDATSQLGVSADVVYAWRTRIVKRARRIGQQLETNFVHAVRFREVANKKGGNGKETAMTGALSPELAAQLEAWPAQLRASVEGISAEEARLAAPNQGFSIVEHAWHLADLEQEAFAIRIGRILEEDFPHLPDFDGDHEARVRGYRERDLETALARFASARAANLRRLERVRPDEWARAAVQDGVGSLTLADLVCRIVDHDRSHAAELLERLAALGRTAAPALVEMAHTAAPAPCAA